MSKFIILGLDGACPGIIADAKLPNFQRLAARGVFAESVPVPSAVTSVNWTALATGSFPRTFGISDFMMHEPGTPLDQAFDVFSKEVNHRAEFVWDALAARGHKTATLSFVGALPQTVPGHLAIGDNGYPEEYSKPYTIAPSRALVSGDLNPVGPYGWHEHERLTGDTFLIEARTPGYRGAHPVRVNGSTFTVAGKSYTVGVREWTPWIRLEFDRDDAAFQRWQVAPVRGGKAVGEFRMRVTRPGLIYVSPVYPCDHFSSDDEVTARLYAELGPYTDNLPISRLLMEWVDADGWIEEFRLQGVWQARAAVKLVNEHGYKAVLTKWHAFDKFYHFFLQKIDPVALGYNPAEHDRYEALHRRLLAVADEMVGIVLDGLRDDTTLVVMSDHGLMASRKAVWVNRWLARNGYIQFAPDGRVDWSRTRAYVAAFLLLKLNLRGREPTGIVTPGAEADRLKAEIIGKLRDWKDPETGAHVMTEVFDPHTEGAFYGLGGAREADIRYFTAPGYTLFRSTDATGDAVLTPIHGPYLGDHGSCRPTTHFGRGSESGICYVAGHGIRAAGRVRDVLMTDIVPTLLHIAGERPLRNQEGAVRYDWLTV